MARSGMAARIKFKAPCLWLSGLGVVLALSWPAPLAFSGDEHSPKAEARRAEAFREFLQTLRPLAEEKGISRATFDAAFAALEPDPAVQAAPERQAEFERPLKSYLDEAVSARRIARGQECLRRWRAELSIIERRFGVPAAIVVAAFGMESDYGQEMGNKDVVRSLATLAYFRPDRPVFRNELLSALVMLDKGIIARSAMKGSWAGAMGGAQFVPSVYLKYAVSFTPGGAPDIWSNPLDTLASIANFLRHAGWKPGLSWGTEAILPQNFGFGSLHQTFAAFAAQGVKSADGASFPQGEATLFLPSGAAGPAFLLSSNYWVLKEYNNSDSYALSLALLADRIEGKGAVRGHWPNSEVFLSRTQKAEIQRGLEKLGFYHGPIDGRFGQASRDAIHAFQLNAGISPADGFARPGLLRRLSEDASRPGQ